MVERQVEDACVHLPSRSCGAEVRQRTDDVFLLVFGWSVHVGVAEHGVSSQNNSGIFF